MANPQALREAQDNQFVVNTLADAATGTDNAAVSDTTQAAETTEQVEQVEQVTQEKQQAIDRASRYGWDDKQKWIADGKSENLWRDAEEFLEVRRGIERVTREELRNRDAKIAALEAKLNAREAKETEDRTRITVAGLELQLKNAVENQDSGEVVRLTREIAKAEVASAIAGAQRPAQAAPIDPVIQERFQSIAAKNPWMLQASEKFDSLMVQRLMRECQAIAATPGNTLGPIEAINEALDTLKFRFPSKFNGSVRRAAVGSSMVDMGGTSGINGGGSQGKTWNDLLPEIRKDAERAVSRGDYTREDFLSNCDAEHFRR